MSGWFDEQLRTRMQSDSEAFSNAFVTITESITGRKIYSGYDDASNALEEIANFYDVPFESEVLSKEAELKLLELELEPENEEEKFSHSLEKIFDSAGIMHREVYLSQGWYKDASGIYLAALKEGRYVALIPDYYGYSYKDYETGKRIRINSRNEKNLHPEAICFYRPLPARKLRVKDLMLYAAKSLVPSDIISIAIITVLATLASMVAPYLMQVLYSQVIYSKNLSSLSAFFAFIISAGFSVTLFNVAKDLALSRINIKTTSCVNAAVMMRVINLPAEFFKNFSSGELAQRTEAASILCSTLATVIFSVSLTALTSLFYLQQIFSFTPVLVRPAILIILALFISSVLLTWGHSKIMKLSAQANAKEYGLIYAFITGIQKIKLAGAEKRAFARWAETYKQIAKLTYDPPLLLKLTQAIQPAITLIGTFILYSRAFSANVSPDNYMAFTASFGLISGAFIALSSSTMSIATIRPLLDLIKPILHSVPEISQGYSKNIHGSIELNNVSFRYNEKMPFILDRISLKIKKGEYVAIVGKSGCGKSTLMRLLLGFEHPDHGVIYYDGQDLKTLNLKALRKNIGCVMQNSKLLPGSIYSNITISAPLLDERQAWEAARMAGIADDIIAMPMRMQTQISEGAGTISGGQRQRIIIARAIAPKPKILLFDEATSALDNITQKIVADSLEKLKCTRIVIAHRLSTVKKCDRILVLDNGKIAETGTYDELIAKNGLFAELVKRQMIEER